MHPPLTKEQAKELFRSVDDILSFVSTDTKLPIQHSVKRKLITRDEVNKYLSGKFDQDEGAKRLERAEIVLKKFGLLDRDFHLRPFLISLLTEQVAGFYDNKTKTVNLLDWIDVEDQKPVLAHELTHALQDQKVDLTKWSEVGSNDIAKNMEEDNRHIQSDEGDTARDAVAEGQAMVVFLDYTLRPTGKTLADSPELADKMKESVSDPAGSPVLARAPLLLQQSLLFPYSEGLSFEDAILLKGGKDAAFAGVLASPPASSFEIMHPAAYMGHVPVPVLHLADIHPLLDAEYTPYDVGVMGEFDVRILTELFGGREIADALTPAWNGGIYYAAQRKSAVTAEAKQSTASLGLFYFSKWKNEDSAQSFLRVYAGELPRKYSGLARRTKAKILQASTSEVYGDPEQHPQQESYWGRVNPIGVRSCYDEGKRCAETLFFDYHRQHGLRIKVARIFNTYGPNMLPNDGRVVSNFIVQALRGEPITLYGSGNQTRAFCYVEELVDGLIRLMDSADSVTGPINLGNPAEFTIRQLAERVLALTGSKSQLELRPLPQDDPRQRKPDITLAQDILQWTPRIELDQGLAPTVEYFRQLLGL